jgi:hypothetical protein
MKQAADERASGAHLARWVQAEYLDKRGTFRWGALKGGVRLSG